MANIDKNFTLWDKFIASFDNSADGFSARKLSAFGGVIIAMLATFKYVDSTVIIYTLIVWLCFSLLCLGIITAEQILKFYKLKDSSESETKEEVVEDKRLLDADPKL